MKRQILLSAMLISVLLASAQNPCKQGDEEAIAPKEPSTEKMADLTTVGQVPYDPNEIIGPEGYDSVRWVSVNDVLNYTIMFENDSNFATAAAQRVDVRFDFADKVGSDVGSLGEDTAAELDITFLHITESA